MYGDIPIEYYTESGREVPSNTYVPGVDFDPSDPEDVESVRLASEWDHYYSLEAAQKRIVALEYELAAQRQLNNRDEE